MSITLSLSALFVAVALVVFANYKARQPLEVGKIRWIPYQGIQFAGIVVICLVIAHLITLVTGEPFKGRFG